MIAGKPEIRHIIIGTAGHIDHGKTALVKALTGIDADTLAEEKRRGITIELGFIFLEPPQDNRQIIFIDVPGHEKLIKTMVAGASNIDAALLVIAADEGISVQTLEHFDILKLLGIQEGIIALAKTDLVDEDHLHALKSEVKDFVKGSFLNDAPIIPVSSITGAGVEEVRSALLRVAHYVGERQDSGIFRMPIDRVFTMKGFGTVIAGTILSGGVKTGDEIEIFPDGIQARVRGIHVHHEKTDRSQIGKRTAINLKNIEKDKLRRGQCAGFPGSLTPTNRFDGKLHLLKSYGKEMRNRARIRLHTGTAEIISRLVLLDRERLLPGETAPAQFILDSPTVAVPRDRFVIRTFSPLMTIGGGSILDSTPAKHKRFDPQTIEELKRLEGDINDVVEQTILKWAFIPISIQQLGMKIGQDKRTIQEAVKRILSDGKLVQITAEKEERFLHKNSYDALADKLLSAIKNYLAKHPYLLSLPYVELRSEFLRWSDSQTLKSIIDNLCDKKLIYTKGSDVGLVGYEIKMDPDEQKLINRIEGIFRYAKYKAPLEEEIREDLGLVSSKFRKIMSSLISRGSLIRLSSKVIYHRETVKAAQALVLDYIKKNQCITVADLRDELKLSRKYAVAILEYFDKIGLTRREEDRHVMS